MVDIFALALSHGLLALAAWRLLSRPDLDVEGARAKKGRAEATRAETTRGTTKPARRGVTWNQGSGKQEAGNRGTGEDA